MQNQNEKQTVKKPAPDQAGKQPSENQQADKKVTGQQNTGNNDGAPVHPMKNRPDKNQQQNKDQGNRNPGKMDSDIEEEMGSGKRQDDN